MKQLQLAFERPEDAGQKFRELRRSLKSSEGMRLLFQLFSGSLDRDAAEQIAAALAEVFPEADYVGCSTGGNILNGDFCPLSYVVTCTVFESPSAQTAVKQYHLDRENVDEVIHEVVDFANSSPWVKAIMLYTTVWEASMSTLCLALDGVRSDVEILGGGAYNAELDSSSSFVLSSAARAEDHSIAFVFIGGPDFSIRTRSISGWKALGKEMEITKAQGNILQEIEGIPAFETYRRYLKIENDDSFLVNTLEFPYVIQNNGVDILRHPHQCLEDGSLVMASDVETARTIRMAYGDPATIMENVARNVSEIREENPDVIAIFSCAGRRSFWGDAEIGNETRAFQTVAPSAGFYTLSEFLRAGQHVNQHNLTLAIATMKETHTDSSALELAPHAARPAPNRRISTVERLANFIDEATRELEEANEHLSELNRMLRDMAILDGMTQLYNRMEIQRRITAACRADMPGKAALIMLDLDDFKMVNDRYGHQEGDRVIRALTRLMREKAASLEGASAGRWGGEEFMMLLEGRGRDEAVAIAEEIRTAFAQISFPMAGFKTVSLGVTERGDSEGSGTLTLRVDQALYKAKAAGKNRTVAL